MMDVFGQALLDHYHGNRTDPLYQRDGPRKYRHRIDEYYFRGFPDEPGAEWIANHLSGPLLDVGAGAGRDTLYFQDKFETTALEISSPLIQLLEDRAVQNICHGNMFSLPDLFAPNQFQSILINGTQIGLVKSQPGFQEFLQQISQITRPGATIIFDCYDPSFANAPQMLGYRADVTPGCAFRVYHYEYADDVGTTLLFRLFDIEQIRSIVQETAWSLTDHHRPHDTYHMQIVLRKTT